MNEDLKTPPHPRPGFRDRRLVAAAALAGLIAYLLFQVLPLWGRHEPGGPPRSHQNDFKHIYLGSWLLAHGQNPYDIETVFEVLPAFAEEDSRFGGSRPGEYRILPYVYLPFTGQILYPITWLRFNDAAHAWMLVNHLLILGGALILVLATERRPGWPEILLLAAAIALNATILRQNNAGQLNAVLFAGYGAVFLGIARGWHPGAIGGLAAFLALFKLTPGILLVYFLCTRKWLHAAWMTGIGILLALAGMLLAGPRVWMEFLPVLRDMGYGKSTWSEFGHTFWRDPANQSINSFLHHVLVPWEGFEPWMSGSAGLANGITIVIALLLFAGMVACLLIANRLRGDRRAAFSLVILTSLLVPSICWDHYLLQSLVPAVLLWTATRSVGLRLAIAASVAVICLPVAFDAGVVAGWRIADPTRGAGILMMSLKLWPLLLLWAIAAWICLKSAAPEAKSSK